MPQNKPSKPRPLSKSKEYKDLPDWSKPESAPRSTHTGVKGQTPAAKAYYRGIDNRQPKDTEGDKSVGFANPQPTVVTSSGGGGSGGSGLTFIILLTLLVLTTWNTIFIPVVDIAWNPGSKTDVTKLPWPEFIGMVVFIFIATTIAGISDDAGTLMAIFSGGVLLVYLVERGGGGITAFVNWANPSASKSTGSSTGSGSPPTRTGGPQKAQ